VPIAIFEGLWHVTPSPTQPLLVSQAHVKEPVVFEHVANGEQLSVFAVHSLTSTQVGLPLAFVPIW